jgi:Zn-dependent protease
VPPLDGSKILGLLLPDGLYARFVYNNVIGLVFVAVLALTGMFERIIFPALNWVMAVLLLPLMNVIMAFLYN